MEATDKVEEKVEADIPLVEEKKEGETEVAQPSYSETEQQAIGFGWKPKEKWVEDGGAEEEWVPAKHFLKFGDLQQRLIAKDKELTKRDKLVKMMKVHHLNVKQQAYEDALKSLKEERRAALDENDLVKAERLRDEIDEKREAFEKSKGLPPEVEEVERETTPTFTPPAAYFDFKSRNPWYVEDSSNQDEMSREADRQGQAIVLAAQQRGQMIQPDQLYREVESRIKKLYSEKFSTPKSPHSEGGTKTSGKSGSGTSLTSEQLEVAKSFGLTPEKYAEQLRGYKGR